MLLALLMLTAQGAAADFRAFLDKYCLDCHDAEAKKGDLDLSRFTDETSVIHDRSVWRRIYEKVESHQMPPPKRDSQPTGPEREMLMKWIMGIAERPDPVLGARDPGKATMRRLTRLEYNNAIRDLFALPMDVFMFPERLPIADKGYFNPASGIMLTEVKVEMREYGGKYPVLCPHLGLPEDTRAEHGFSNRGDAMSFSPLLFEKYMNAAREIVNAPDLAARSPILAELIDAEKRADPTRATSQKVAPSVPLVEQFASAFPQISEAQNNSIPLAEFRRQISVAFAEGRGGVLDMPSQLASKTISGKDGFIQATFGGRTLSLRSNADLWIAEFGTVKPASVPAVLANRVKGKTSYALNLSVSDEHAGYGVEHVGLCVMGRKGQQGKVEVSAILTDDSELTRSLEISDSESGTTFCSFSAPSGKTIKQLVVDGSELKGDYLVLDDIGLITRGPAQAGPAGPLEPGPPAHQGYSQSSTPERLKAFVERAFRRAVPDEEMSSILRVYDGARRDNATEVDAIRQALVTVLASPAFLFVEANGVPGAGKIAPLEDAELATRLSLFVCASTPDTELLNLAKQGRLRDTATLEAQTRRLLKDARCRELSESFAVQWLRLDQLYTAKPDPDIFKNFYSGPQGKNTLHGAALTEALLLFETVMVEDRSILEFLAADYTWLNPQLARFYDMRLESGESEPVTAVNSNRELKTKTEKGAVWRRVKLADGRRGGFMTMAAPMIVTSLPFRTSPVKRGAWLLETIFNRPPTEPKVAFAIENDTKEAAQQMSTRQKFEAHRNKAACYSCHIRLDPPGFALEHFNPVGQWRDTDAGVPVDAKGEWNGETFDGPDGFKAILMRHPREFTRGFVEHLLSYALGRPLDVYDMPMIEEIQQAAMADGWKFSRVIVEIVKSYPFTQTRSLP